MADTDDLKSGTNAEPEMVALTDASNEDVDAALSNAQAYEREHGVPEEAKPETPETSRDTASPDPRPEAAHASGADPATTSEPIQPRVYTEDEVQGLIAARRKAETEGAQKESFIQRRNNEVGQLRKQNETKAIQLRQVREALVRGLDSKFEESPAEALNDRDQIRAIDDEINDLENHTIRAEMVAKAQVYFEQVVGSSNTTPAEMIEVLKADGINDPQFLGQFVQNPFTSGMSGDGLIQLGKRAIERRERMKDRENLQTLSRSYLELHRKLEGLQGQPNRVIQNVQRNLNRAPSINGGHPSRQVVNGADTDVTRMSNEEIADHLRRSSH